MSDPRGPAYRTRGAKRQRVRAHAAAQTAAAAARVAAEAAAGAADAYEAAYQSWDDARWDDAYLHHADGEEEYEYTPAEEHRLYCQSEENLGL